MKKKKTRSERLQEVLEGVVSLLVLFLMLAASVVYGGKLLGHDFNDTKADATATTAPPSDSDLQALGLAGSNLDAMGASLWRVASAEGKMLGTIVSTAEIGKDIQGYAGATPLYVYIDKDERVKAIVPMANSETPDFFNEAKTLLTQWSGVKVSEASTKKVDAVSGATFSSNALIGNVHLALDTYAQADTSSVGRQPGIGWVKALCAIAVMIFSAFVHLQRKGKKHWRIVALSLNVLVLGFWTGQFISLGLLRSWVANGFDWLNVLPALFMLLLTLGLAFFGHKHHHCVWACPYGSIQDLAYRLPLPKIKVKPYIMQRMRRLRQGILLLLLLLAWMGVGIEPILEYEPFSAFLVTVAAPGTLILAGAFLVTSLFVPRLWCTAFCPVGEVLELAYDMKSSKASKGNTAVSFKPSKQ
ncbi:MAG: 4Fe-4S binding protein [Bacteroidales bacterium]|nr:4Fe-4S binding protein [Bacteroidales bacterium]